MNSGPLEIKIVAFVGGEPTETWNADQRPLWQERTARRSQDSGSALHLQKHSRLRRIRKHKRCARHGAVNGGLLRTTATLARAERARRQRPCASARSAIRRSLEGISHPASEIHS